MNKTIPVKENIITSTLTEEDYKYTQQTIDILFEVISELGFDIEEDDIQTQFYMNGSLVG